MVETCVIELQLTIFLFVESWNWRANKLKYFFSQIVHIKLSGYSFLFHYVDKWNLQGSGIIDNRCFFIQLAVPEIRYLPDIIRPDIDWNKKPGIWLIENLAIRLDFGYLANQICDRIRIFFVILYFFMCLQWKKIFLVIFDGSTSVPTAYSISETCVK